MKAGTTPLWIAVAGAAGFHCAPADTIALTADMDSCLAVEVQVAILTTAAHENTTLDWSGLTTDLYGHPMDPAADVDSVWAFLFGFMTPAEVVFELNCGALSQADVSGGWGYAPGQGETAARLDDFDEFLTMEPESDFIEGTWVMTVQRDDVREPLALALVAPTADAAVQTIDFGEDSASLIVHQQGGHAPIPQVVTPVVWLDWSFWAMTDSGGDCGICPGSGGGGPPDIDLIRLARYDPTVAQPDLDMITFDALAADVVYEAFLSDDEMRFELTSLETEEGGRFTGFDEEGSWMLGLLGDRRTHWTPYFLGRIDD